MYDLRRRWTGDTLQRKAPWECRLDGQRTDLTSAQVQQEEAMVIDEVVCVGAATWMPSMREMMVLITGVEPTASLFNPEAEPLHLWSCLWM